MRSIILLDNSEVRANLLPLTYTRPVSLLQTGILTIEEKWQRLLPGRYSHSTIDYLDPKFPTDADPSGDNVIIASHIVPDAALAREVAALARGEALTKGGATIARRGMPVEEPASTREYEGKVDTVGMTYDIFRHCGEWIASDFTAVTAGRAGQPLPCSNTLIGDPSQLFIEEGASVEGAIINVSHGPVYIGRGAEVMEGSCLRGPVAVMDNAHVNMGARIYGPTVIGAWSKVGGELNNVVMHPYSNKAHDGFLGNAVIGSWCNLGAGCTASNLKNDYTEIKLWNYPSRRFLRTGLQFCGLIMGDHSKAGINTMFNTATVVGVGVNIHGTGFPRNFVASFSEGSATAGFTDVSLNKFCQIAQRVMARRGLEFTEADRSMFEAIRAIAESYK